VLVRITISFTAFDETYLLPTIGLYINQALSPKWSITRCLGGIGLDLGDDFKGTVIEAKTRRVCHPVHMSLCFFFKN